MRVLLCLVMVFVLGSFFSAHAAPVREPFLQVGSSYSIVIPNNTTGLTVKIIGVGPSLWYWVEYDFTDPTGDAGPVRIVKKREWLNFALVTTFEPRTEEDYPLIYPHGFKIIPYGH